ncbi:MAG: aldo/keto reductase [Ignavibacteriaceae bacterium]|jgi:aryl-alcohol dehydrogenase-like predicted oxidoreductase
MNYKLLGKSGLRVSELALGTMTFGEEWGWGVNKEESKKVFDRYSNEDGNFIDTANRYTEGTSEKYVGEFIASDREHYIVATKYSLFTRRDDPNFSGNHRKNMMQALDASLKRLKTDYSIFTGCTHGIIQLRKKKYSEHLMIWLEQEKFFT